MSASSTPQPPQGDSLQAAAVPQLSPAELQAKRERVQALTEAAIEELANMDLAAAVSILRIGRIETTEDPRFSTAALVKEGDDFGGFRIVMNTHFCDRPQSQVTCILLHELLHHIMRHLDGERLGSDDGLANIVEDAFINYTIFLLNPTLAKFFRDFYPSDESPFLFLRSRSKPGKDSGDADMYQGLYRGKITEKDLYNYLEDKGEGGKKAKRVILIGSHGEPGQGQGNSGESIIPEEDLQDLLEEIMEQLQGSKKGSQQAGKFNKLLQEFIRVRRGSRDPGIEDIFKRSLVNEVQAQIIETMAGDVKDRPKRSVIMPERLSRSDMIKSTMGVPVFFWDTFDENTKHGSVVVYLDVSGSMGEWIEFIYGCCLAFEEYLNTDIFLFSNKIEPITLKDLQQGKVTTTGGTDFDCIVDHYLESDADRAIIFTDGYAGLKAELREQLEKSGKLMNGVITHRGSRSPLDSFTDKLFEIPNPAAR